MFSPFMGMCVWKYCAANMFFDIVYMSDVQYWGAEGQSYILHCSLFQWSHQHSLVAETSCSTGCFCKMAVLCRRRKELSGVPELFLMIIFCSKSRGKIFKLLVQVTQFLFQLWLMLSWWVDYQLTLFFCQRESFDGSVRLNVPLVQTMIEPS